MNQRKMTFESHKLEVDFLTLSMKNLSDPNKIYEFANYLFKNFGFNSFLSEGNTRKITQTLCQNLAIKDTLIIRINYWEVTFLEFPGRSAQKLYHLLKSQQLDWRFFPSSSLRLTHFDLCYQLIKNDFFDSRELDDFLIQSRRRTLDFTTTRNVKLINGSTGVILRINKRSNLRYVRVYETPTSIRFELESKNLALKNVADFLLNYQFDVFESRLTQFYFYYIKKFFPLDNFFVAWLIDFLRKYSPNQTNSQVVLGTEYFTDVTSIFKNQSSQKVYHLLQFLNFIKTLDNQDCTTYPFEERNYFIHVFPLSNFINFIGMKQSKTQ